MFVVPVLAVGGWGWWSSRRMSRNRRGDGGGGTGTGGIGGATELTTTLDVAPLDVVRH